MRFEWVTGRVLGAFQVVWIAAGTGEFESQASGLVSLEAGMAVLLFPGVWHRYRPHAETGWTEKWVELGGEAIDRLLAVEVIGPARCSSDPLAGIGKRTSDGRHA